MNYTTRWELIKLLNKRVSLTSAQRIALDEYLEPYTVETLGRKRTIILLMKQAIADMEQRGEAA